MPWPSTGEKLPLVTVADRLAVDEHGAPGPRRAAALGGDADELAGDAGVALGERAASRRGTPACPTPRPTRARPAAA